MSATRHTPLETVLGRDGALVLASLVGVAALAWLYLVKLALDMAEGDTSLTDISRMGAMADAPWDGITFVLTFVMWLVMMTGMMVPSAAPMILLYAVVRRKAAEKGQPIASANVFAAGYMIVWGAFAAVATILQWGLHDAALLSARMTSTSPVLGGIVLIAAGLYQFAPIKRACLKHCRAPLHFLGHHWRKGTRGAVRMGIEHGLFCVGCCWVLMTLLFVGGIMNLLWVAAIMVFVLIEKVAPYGDVMGRIAGTALLVAGTLMIART